MQIRRLTPADAGAYRDLRLRGLREHPDAFRSSYEEEQGKSADWSARRLGGREGFFLGAFNDAGALIGAVGLQLEQRYKLRHQGQVIGMYVASEYVRRGVGRALIEALIMQAHTIDHLESLMLTVTSTNAHAVRLYRSTGFVECGREPRALKIDGRYFDKTLMFRGLRPE
jgi:ribosomal protein S18 acetylase RimI-like enzyme